MIGNESRARPLVREVAGCYDFSTCFELKENRDPRYGTSVKSVSNRLLIREQIVQIQTNVRIVRPKGLKRPGMGLFLFSATVIVAAIACSSSTPAQEPPATQSDPAPASLSCELSGPASGFALQAVPGIDPVPTAFDGVNDATCTFSDAIESVTVRLFTVGGPLDGFEAHVETITVRPPSSTVVFPLDFGGGRKILSSLLPLGPYTRSMEARTVGGASLAIQTEAFEVSTDIFLVDPPNATAYAPLSVATDRKP